jgi:glycosyltransferase involved in cell wall biosynthesis
VRILTFMDHYLPSVKAGGAVRTVSNMAAQLGQIYQFMIVCMDRDAMDDKSFDGICHDTWIKKGQALVMYLRPNTKRNIKYIQLLRKGDFDIVYLNSFFSVYFSTVPLLIFRLLRRKEKLIIAPRGEFSAGALKLKWPKKKFFILFVRFFGLYRGAIWQASSLFEAADIKRNMGPNVMIHLAQDLTLQLQSDDKPKKTKKSNFLNIAFVSRISRKKNLDGALNMLGKVKGEAVFNIYGPIEDAAYWEECQKIISGMPSTIKIVYHGSVSNEDVMKIFTASDLFFFPTYGENFGHVILESLSVGCPVLISDQTPWNDLEKEGAGWGYGLANEGDFVERIEKLIQLTNEEFQKLSEHAFNYAKRTINNPEFLEQNRCLFDSNSTF